MTDFDFQKNSAALKIDTLVYLRILNAAVTQTQNDFPAADAALSRRDTATLQTLSHRWKGDFDNLRVTALADIARQINAAAKIGEFNSGLEEDYRKFKSVFEELREATLKKG